ncbi:MAG: hypothetical protein KJZ58_13970 [Flavobacteriales bacterium]|nr:hypothetical protein [Flavobacteriales bacterium]
MNTPDLLNVLGLVLNSVAAILLVVSAPVPQRVIYMGDVEDVAPNQRKDRMTKRAYWFALRMLVLGFLLQLVAQLLR